MLIIVVGLIILAFILLVLALVQANIVLVWLCVIVCACGLVTALIEWWLLYRRRSRIDFNEQPRVAIENGDDSKTLDTMDE